ncbi:photosystem reaction center subunit H [Microvirga vignae]|uniref:Photosystem reaction center subunit H n=1 Tax=Microvirga vignae TaxID=1225564 RepID=A0A0H1RFP5_9HYPH|nr:PRC-barrel domain-containing protein [Microvirga vignae]KLK94020.1 photosystem reaction center subunit H [Microvirga vignae]
MVAKHLAIALLGSALIGAPALAQNQPAGSGTTGAPAATSPTTTTSPAAGGAGSMTQMQPGQWRASKLEGLDVYNQNDEKIGDVSEMLVDQSGKIQAVVVGVGGFLGIGEHDVAIPFDQVKFVNEPRRTAATTTTTGTAGTGATAPSTTTTAPSTTGSTAGTTASTADTADRSMPDHAMVNMTKDQLKAMPEFKYTR